VGRLADVHYFADLGLRGRGFHGFLQSSEARSLYHSPEEERNGVFAGYLNANPISLQEGLRNEMGLLI
jgi:hypothetical protein